MIERCIRLHSHGKMDVAILLSFSLGMQPGCSHTSGPRGPPTSPVLKNVNAARAVDWTERQSRQRWCPRDSRLLGAIKDASAGHRSLECYALPNVFSGDRSPPNCGTARLGFEKWRRVGPTYGPEVRSDGAATTDRPKTKRGIATLKNALQELKKKIYALHSSKSWRFTAPFSAIKRPWLAVRTIKHSGLFDRDWYLNEYPDARMKGLDPTEHYLRFGAQEGRNPSRLFGTNEYLSRYPDVRAAGINPLLHFILYGAAEGRVASGDLQGPNSDPDVAPRRVVSDYDKWHEREALKAISTIEKFNGTKLSPHHKRMADEYAIGVLGKQEYAPWLYVYTLVSGHFKEGWIPDNFFGLVRREVNNGLGELSVVKTLSKVVLRTDALPDIAYYIDGVFYDRDFTRIEIAALREIIAQTCSDVFIKKDGGGQGTGVKKLAATDIHENIFEQFGNCVIQSPIMQHRFFEKIISGSVATLRITTVKNRNRTFEMRASYLRFGRSDTAWVQSANSVKVAIVDGNGELDCFGYTQDWRRWSSHPDTNFVFSKQRIPRFKEAVETCIKLHASVPHFGIIGWDVAIGDDDTIKLIEWNAGHTGIKFSEATTGPCFTGLNWEKLRSA